MAKPRTDWDNETVARFTAAYMSDETVAAIAAGFSCTPSHVCRMARRFGLSRRRRHGDHRKWTAAEERRLAELVAQACAEGQSVRWVADKMSRKYASTHQRMQVLGLHIPRTWISDELVRSIASLSLTRHTAARLLGVSRTRIWELEGTRNRIARDDPDALVLAEKIIAAARDRNTECMG